MFPFFVKWDKAKHLTGMKQNIHQIETAYSSHCNIDNGYLPMEIIKRI